MRSLIDAMWHDALGSSYLCTDAAGVLLQANETCRVGHFWVLMDHDAATAPRA